MKRLLLCTAFCCLLFSCKSLRNSLERTSDTANASMTNLIGQLEEIKGELMPIDSVIRNALITSINSLNEDENYEQIDSLSAKFTRSLIKNLDELGLEKRMTDITNSVKESLLNEDTQQELKSLVSAVLNKATGDLDKTINEIIGNIDTDKLTYRLLAARNKLLSEGLSDSLSSTLNQVIAGLDFAIVREKLLTELNNEEVKETIRNMTRTPLDEVEVTGQGFLDTIRKYAGRLLLGVLGVAAAIIVLVYKFRRKNHRDISVLLMKEIEKQGNVSEIKTLKNRIRDAAIQQNLEKEIQQTLKEVNIN